MPLIPMRVLLDHAAEHGYGVAAFNVNNMEQIQAIMAAASELDAPVIVQASSGARSYSQDAYLRHLMLAAVELYPHIPIVMHQDHGNTPDTCASAIKQGFTSVMMDGSLMPDQKTPSDFKYNVEVTRKVVKMAHRVGVSVEGEVGCLGKIDMHASASKAAPTASVSPASSVSVSVPAPMPSVASIPSEPDAALAVESTESAAVPAELAGELQAETSVAVAEQAAVAAVSDPCHGGEACHSGGNGHPDAAPAVVEAHDKELEQEPEPESAHLTDPDEAERFVAATGVDALAVAIGTSHGAYKFDRPPDGAVLAMDRIIEIHRRLPNCHLVMHGSSSVPQALRDKINQYGGRMKQAWGVPVEEIQLGIRNGVRKINVDTDNRMAMTAAIRELLATAPEKFDPRDYLKPAREAMKEICRERMIAFGQAGQARKIRVVTLAQMAVKYAAASEKQAKVAAKGKAKPVKEVKKSKSKPGKASKAKGKAKSKPAQTKSSPKLSKVTSAARAMKSRNGKATKAAKKRKLAKSKR